ncbi:MAG TPA: serine hydrolase [Humibacter sp.]|nr:serine hydrolase [Humibacter sp.]
MDQPMIAFSLLDGAGRPIAERASTQSFYAASTIKLAVMLAAALEVDAGRLRLEQTLRCRHSFPSSIAGAPHFTVPLDDRDSEFPPDDAEATVAELIEMMITRSSNEATNLLVGRVGLRRVQAAIARCCTAETTMRRLIGDAEAADAGLTNTVTAADLALLMHSIATGRITGARTTEFMRGTLGRQRHVRIAAELPPGTDWGSKAGNVDGVEHDVAFIGHPGSSSARYLAVCARGYDEEQGREAIRALTAMFRSLDQPGMGRSVRICSARPT